MKLALLKAASYVLGHMPWALATALGRLLGRLAWSLDKKHRNIVLENLRRAFGESLSDEERNRIAKKVFVYIAWNFFEFTRLPWLTRENLKGYLEYDGLEKLNSALDRKKGVMLITGHFGNWELFPPAMGLAGFPLDIVARELDDPVFEEFIKWVRTRHGHRAISKNRSMRKLMKSLSENGITLILVDQNVALAEGVFVDFFGAPACTNKGPALLAAATKAAVVPAFIVREGRGHRLLVLDEVEVADTGDREADVLENTRRFTSVVEAIVRRYPDQWFWVHRRWKTRPPNN